MLLGLAVAGIGHYVVRNKWVTGIGLFGAALGAAGLIWALTQQDARPDAKILPFPGRAV